MIPAASPTGPRGPLRPLSVAPMLDWTDRHYRAFARLLTRRALLYTEMVTTGALLHGNAAQLLRHAESERPLALQLGGDDPAALAACARLAADAGFDEVNLNVGCPSDRVMQGGFGACLMANPALVAASVAAMRAAVELPVTVKHRLGIEWTDEDGTAHARGAYEDLEAFVQAVAAAGCDRFVVHARVARLGGLSPKENRTVPPLRYEDVYRLKAAYPHLRIELNGGVPSPAAAGVHLAHVDGVMLGRAAYVDPYVLATADRVLYGDAAPGPTRREVVDGLRAYLAARAAEGVPAKHVTRHVLGLFHGEPGARGWRRILSTGAPQAADAVALLDAATREVPDEVLDARPGSRDEATPKD